MRGGCEAGQFQLILGNSITESKMLSSNKAHYLRTNPSVPAEFCRDNYPLETGGAIGWAEAAEARPSVITNHIEQLHS